MQLPISDPIALEHSEQLTDFIRQEILLSNGMLSFARFMELALYAPGLGYYVAGQHKLGKHGDFITAPHISPLFAQSIARQCQQVLNHIPQGSILEIGAGSGIFAKDLLLALEKLNTLPVHYFILEVSADLRERQRQLFLEKIPHLLERIQWLERLPSTPIHGIILANEVMDALPVHLFKLDEDGIKEQCVVWQDNQFVWKDRPADSVLEQEVKQLSQEMNFPLPYQSEIHLFLSGWIRSIVSALQSGIILLLDYGYGRAEYYHADRCMGTLMCYFQHRKHDNPLTLVGLQDITAHVDFTRLLESIDPNDCALAGFTTQAHFLLSCGLLSIAEEEKVTDPLQQYQNAQAIKQLILPAEMGELIKVIAFQKHFEIPLLGFQLQDRRRDL
jgi:SAM-dependent MidA family methyltransferase